MNKDELKEASERRDSWTRWNPKEARISPPANQQSSDDFIAQGGRVIYGEPVKFDYFAQAKKTGFMDRA